MVDKTTTVVTMTDEDRKQKEAELDLEVMRKAEAARRGAPYIPRTPASKLPPDVKRKLSF
jgi:hypothetical protein